MDFQHDRESFLGSRQPRSSQLRSQWEAPSTWEALSFDEDDRRSRAVRKVALAVFLFVAGFAMLAGGVYLKYTQPGEGRATALLVLGSVCFLPGAYHTRLAWLAWRGAEGYSLSAIPDL